MKKAGSSVPRALRQVQFDQTGVRPSFNRPRELDRLLIGHCGIAGAVLYEQRTHVVIDIGGGSAALAGSGAPRYRRPPK